MNTEFRKSAAERLWVKSSYSSGAGGECVEVALEWHKSSYSSEEGGECVEIATCPHAIHIHVRDSKDIARPGLTVSAAAWTAFLSGPPKE
ncbi:DUF397 domain-containing protein [Streptomyces odontomachi]|uniref:DUF397 domain-containing protein n=1 Tax=Streptomyces odontomachi TaxID=2944940 RepID=UPI00210EDCC1|nr:DUF397 domain-containing protein [Streptomyces sp. ODS25]